MGECNQEEGEDKAKNGKWFAAVVVMKASRMSDEAPRISFGVENRKPAEVAMVVHEATALPGSLTGSGS